MSNRGLSAGMTVHVIQRGNNKARIFESARDSALYLEWLGEAAATYGLAVHAYVLMTNHIHLLCSLANKNSLARTMQSLGIRYTRYFNAAQTRTGTLWEGRFRSCVIDSDAYFIGCSRYIEMASRRRPMCIAGRAIRPTPWGVPTPFSRRMRRTCASGQMTRPAGALTAPYSTNPRLRLMSACAPPPTAASALMRSIISAKSGGREERPDYLDARLRARQRKAA